MPIKFRERLRAISNGLASLSHQPASVGRTSPAGQERQAGRASSGQARLVGRVSSAGQARQAERGIPTRQQRQAERTSRTGRASPTSQAFPAGRLRHGVATHNARAPNENNVSLEAKAFINYDQYKLSRTELVKSLLIWSGMLFFISYSFYQSPLLSLLATPLSCFLISYDRKKLIAKRKQRMRLQLKDVLLSLVSSLSVGRSLENCFAVASEDMAMLYHRTDVELIGELEIINHRVRNGDSIELSLQKLADRANIEELSQFVEALQTCKRSGGDLLAVMRRTATMLSDQIAVDNEIKVLLAQKKLEGRIMMATPFVFLQFFHSMSPSYMDALQTPIGYILLTIVLLLLLLLFWIMDKIMTIRL